VAGSYVNDTCTAGSPQPETCNNIDDNCNGSVDEGLTQPTSCGVGACASTGHTTCVAGSYVNDTCTPGSPQPETCNNIDDNCNGSTDEGTDVPTTCGVGVCVLQPDTCTPPSGTACDDGNPCTVGDTCGGGVCNAGSTITAPPETANVMASNDKATYTWSVAAFATRYDVVRGSLAAFPVGPGNGDELCFDDLSGTTLVDGTTPAPGTGFWYLSRGENSCGIGTYGDATGGPRTTTTCSP
jgi:hypothetical protein